MPSLCFSLLFALPQGHAFEARLYAENPENNFLPAGGRVLRWRVPPRALAFANATAADATYVRVDSGVREGDLVSLPEQGAWWA
jgi:3-methylcrotonyl-CoA carboxylase alpha subunit